ncbi:MAG: TetR/AcrR family transcriptional repressor of nem operon [Rhodothermales bacterium]|jgi:TetR/AcrR family transcriptional repressor of nem operon
MARPRSFNIDEALHQAMRVFWAKGYEATSMTDLMDAMHLHKGSIYQAFGDKHQLYKAALTQYTQSGISAMRNAVADAASPFEAVRDLMRMSIRQCVVSEGASGCFMMNSAVELGTVDEEVRGIVESVMAHVREMLTDLLRTGQEAGEFRADLEPKSMAEFLMTVKAGILTSGKIHLPGMDPFDTINTALAGLRPRI